MPRLSNFPTYIQLYSTRNLGSVFVKYSLYPLHCLIVLESFSAQPQKDYLVSTLAPYRQQKEDILTQPMQSGLTYYPPASRVRIHIESHCRSMY